MKENSLKNSNNVQVIVYPFMNCGFQLMDLNMKEEILGEVAYGNMTLMSDGSSESKDAIEKSDYGVILIEDLTPEEKGKGEGLKWKVPFFITERNSQLNEMSITFLCISDSDFFTELQFEEYDNIDDALEFSYKGKKDIRIKPDGKISDIPIKQYQENAYNLCSRLAKSYKKKTIYAFGWEGLLIKDICGEFSAAGEKEPSMIIDDSQFQLSAVPNVSFSKELNSTPADAWECPENEKKYKKMLPKFVTSTFNRDAYCIVSRDYAGLMENFYYNDRMLKGTFSTYRAESIKAPRFKLGDALVYIQPGENTRNNCNVLVCASNEIFFSKDGSKKKSRTGSKFSWACTFLGLERTDQNGEMDEDYDE